MADLQRFVNYACGLINFDTKSVEDKGSLLAAFQDFAESYNKITNYYLIFHDDGDNGVVHIHFIFYSVRQVQLITYFNKMRKYFVPNYTRDEKGINLEKCENFNSHLLYLIHQDNKSIQAKKKQYDITDFVSNVELEDIDRSLHSKKGSIDAFYLRDCVLDCPYEFDLMVKLSLPVYHKYRYEIQAIREESARLNLMREKEKEESVLSKVDDLRDSDIDVPF